MNKFVATIEIVLATIFFIFSHSCTTNAYGGVDRVGHERSFRQDRDSRDDDSPSASASTTSIFFTAVKTSNFQHGKTRSLQNRVHFQSASTIKIDLVGMNDHPIRPIPSTLFPGYIYNREVQGNNYLDIRATSTSGAFNWGRDYVKFNVTNASSDFMWSNKCSNPPFTAFGERIGAVVLAMDKYVVSAVWCTKMNKRNHRCSGVPTKKSFIVLNDYGVRDFTLINANTNRILPRAFSCAVRSAAASSTGSICAPKGQRFTIRADTFGRFTKSVKITLTGPVRSTRVDNNPPYTLFGDRDAQGNYPGRLLPAGKYTVTAQAYWRPNAQGPGSPLLSHTFTVAR